MSTQTERHIHLVVEVVSRPAGAHKAAECVAAPPVITEARHGPALVNVLQYDGDLVRLEARPARADNLVLSRAGGGAGLTPGAPGLA